MTSRREAQQILHRARQIIRQTSLLDGGELWTRGGRIVFKTRHDALIQHAPTLRYQINPHALQSPRRRV